MAVKRNNSQDRKMSDADKIDLMIIIFFLVIHIFGVIPLTMYMLSL